MVQVIPALSGSAAGRYDDPRIRLAMRVMELGDRRFLFLSGGVTFGGLAGSQWEQGAGAVLCGGFDGGLWLNDASGVALL